MKPLLFVSIFLLILSLSSCSECGGKANSVSDCSSKGKDCCYSIWDYTIHGKHNRFETCTIETDPSSRTAERSKDINNQGGTVNENIIQCGQYHLRFDLLSLMLLLLF